MKVLITGASSGIGYDMAHIFSKLGYDIIAVARRKDRLEQLKKEVNTNVEILCCDVTNDNDCNLIAEKASEADIFINNAGFGVFGDLCTTDLKAELEMLNTNVRAVHILTKLVAQKYKVRNYGKILNVSSLASFFPGPLFGAYYASKSYVLRLSQALAEELRREKSNVTVSVLCPGPVQTEFGKVAGVSFGAGNEKGANLIVLSSKEVAEYAVKKLLKGKEVIIPGAIMKTAAFLRHILPDKLLASAVFKIQSKKCVKKDDYNE